LTIGWRPWLPAGFADRMDVRSALSDEVTNWASAWFASPCLGAVDFGRSQVVGDGPVVLAIDAADQLQLAALAADVTDPIEALSGADRTLLRGLGDEMFADLRRRLQALLAPTAENGFGGADVEMRLGPKGLRPSLRIGLAETTLVGLAKRLMEPPAPASGPLETMTSALTETRLTVDATLGKVDLTLGDLRGLATGDVLVLDTPLDGKIGLSLSGSETQFATALLSQTGDDMTLTVSRQTRP